MALCKMLSMSSSSGGEYSWKNRTAFGPFASATSSMDCDAAVDKQYGRPSSPATLAEFSSPSGW